MSDRVDELRRRLLDAEQIVTTSGLSRLWKTGRSAAGMATTVLGGRFRGNGTGIEAADLDSVVRLVERLGELKGVAMKAGQILGYVDPSLSTELREVLSVLQTASPASPFVEVERTIREAFGPRADDLLRGFERAPIAVASIGQVHRATLPDGSAVAVKIRHAGIQAALASDFETAGAGTMLASIVMGAAGDSIRSFVEEARTAMLEECDFELEATRQSEFVRRFSTDPDIVVPSVVSDWCGAAVLTTRWHPGLGLEAWLASSPTAERRRRIGEALFRFYVGTLYRYGSFHADPHPGNYALTDDGRITIYDFGCVRQFDRKTVRAFARLVAAVRDDDANTITDTLVALGTREPPAMDDHLRSLLRGFFAPVLVRGSRRIRPDEGLAARQIMRDKRAIMRLALPGKLLFLFRLRFGLYAVLARLEAEADWAALESSWADDALTDQAF